MKRLKHPVFLGGLFMSLMGCRHKQPSLSCPTITEPDSISFRSAQATSNPTLQRGQQSTVTVTVQYTLASRDSAFMELNLDQFPSVSTCSRDMTGMIPLLPASRISMTRGSHVIQVPLIWPGDTGEGTGGKIFAKGSLSLEASIIAEGLNYNLLTTRFGLNYCQQF